MSLTVWTLLMLRDGAIRLLSMRARALKPLILRSGRSPRLEGCGRSRKHGTHPRGWHHRNRRCRAKTHLFLLKNESCSVPGERGRRALRAGRRRNPLTGRASQTHKPGERRGLRIILKMFHVKHFCKVEAKNLAGPKTAASLSICEIDRFFGAIGIGCVRRFDGNACCGKPTLR